MSFDRTGFDTYFKALRPKTAKVCGSVGGLANHSGGGLAAGAAANASGFGENQYYRNAVKGSRIYNCRNPWFRQFWEQHFKCRFNTSASGGTNLPECKGGDKLTYYEQEGLVPFVGELLSSLICIFFFSLKKLFFFLFFLKSLNKGGLLFHQS